MSTRYIALALALAPLAAADSKELKPKCAGMSKGAECWKVIANKPGCHFWEKFLVPDRSVTWSGTCSGDVAIGKGALVGTGGSHNPSHFKGTLDDGKQHGTWVRRDSDGVITEEDHYVNGEWQD